MVASGPRNIAPHSNELEISLFGPGIGECVVVHLGNGEWMVVDSCMNADRSRAVAIDYLEDLGVDVRTQLKLIVVTHWHDDHIDGVSQLVQTAKSARVAISAAFQSKQFGEMVAIYSKTLLVERTSGVSEFECLLEEFKTRRGNSALKLGGPDFWALDGLLLHRPAASGIASVTALSPSSQTLTDAFARFMELMPEKGDHPRRLPRLTPNDLSIALRIDTPGFFAVLGGDLENVSDPLRGWNAVITSPVRHPAKGQAIKIAHHGSQNGDHPEIWSELLQPSPLAMLTPYSRGRDPLPTEGDIQRLQSNTAQLFCTTWPPTKRPPRRDSAVQRTIKQVTRSHRAVPSTVGHIRLRTPIGGSFEPTIDLYDGAVRL